MAEKPPTPPPGGLNTPPGRQQGKGPAGNPASHRRVAARKLREEHQQRLVVLITAATIGLALVAILAGLAYDRLWVPSRSVARVGSVTLNRGDYWAERKNAYAREIVQNFQLLAYLGGNPQYTQQFQDQSPQIDKQVEKIRSAEVDSTIVDQWTTRQIKFQGAAGRGVNVSDDEVNQALVKELGQIFLPPPSPPITTTTPTTTTTLPATTGTSIASGSPTPGGPTITPVVTPTNTPSPTHTPSPTNTPSPTPGGPTATPAPTATAAPTSTPEPTPGLVEAKAQVSQIIDDIYRRYEIELAKTQEKPDLTKDDFLAALRDQYHEQVVNDRVEAQLVPAEGFTYSKAPTRVRTSQVLVAVKLAQGATQAQIDAAFAEGQTKADAILTRLRGGEDFATVAAASSDDPGSKAQGGDMGFFDKDGKTDSGALYPPELVKQAFALTKDALSAPIRSQFGWHILKLTELDVPSEDQQLREARTKALDAWVAEQRTTLTVARFPEPTPTLTVMPTEPVPTPVPTFASGPPTVAPTATLAPTGSPTAPAVTVAPIGSPTAPGPTVVITATGSPALTPTLTPTGGTPAAPTTAPTATATKTP